MIRNNHKIREYIIREGIVSKMRTRHGEYYIGISEVMGKLGISRYKVMRHMKENFGIDDKLDIMDDDGEMYINISRGGRWEEIYQR